MGEPVYLNGRALASALGTDLDAALDCLRRGGVAPRALDAAPGERWPYFAIDDDTPDWYARAERQIRHVIAESGAESPKDMGKVMKAVMPKTAGRADGGRVSAMVKKLLAG